MFWPWPISPSIWPFQRHSLHLSTRRWRPSTLTWRRSTHRFFRSRRAPYPTTPARERQSLPAPLSAAWRRQERKRWRWGKERPVENRGRMEKDTDYGGHLRWLNGVGGGGNGEKSTNLQIDLILLYHLFITLFGQRPQRGR